MGLAKDKIATLLCTAFEGGSNYWYLITGYEDPKPADVYKFDGDVFPHICFPLSKGGAVLIQDTTDDGKAYRLTLAEIRKGWKIFKEKYPRHYADVLKGNDDACTGDVFLQCCLFGEEIYG